MQVHYLEIVTPEVDAVCRTMAVAHGATFGDPVEALGNARTTILADNRRIGVRAPMRDNEEPIIRPYFLTEDIDAAVKRQEQAGADIALPPTEVPGVGTFAICIIGGVHLGLWQV